VGHVFKIYKSSETRLILSLQLSMLISVVLTTPSEQVMVWRLTNCVILYGHGFQDTLQAPLISFWLIFMLFIGEFHWLERWISKMLFAIPILSTILTFSRSQHLNIITHKYVTLFKTTRISSTLHESSQLHTPFVKTIVVLIF